MLDPKDLQKEIDTIKQAHRLHGFNKRCIICGEADPRCIELHHLPERGYGDTKVPVCRNCHRKVTDRKQNKRAPDDPSQLECVAHWLISLAVFLFELAKRAYEFGQTLLEAAKVCPPPFGTLGGLA
jgi:hypothetical protein